MPSPLYAYEENGEKTLFVVDFRGQAGRELVVSFQEVAEHVRSCPPNSLLSMTLAQGIEYSPAAMKAALDLARSNGRYMKKSAIVGLDYLTGLVNVINRIAGRSIRAFHEDDTARDWLLKDE